MTTPNKQGADWALTKGWLNTQIAKMQDEMLSPLTPEEYHRARGGILLARELIEWVEPTTPPKVEGEDDYGISDPDKEKYT